MKLFSCVMEVLASICILNFESSRPLATLGRFFLTRLRSTNKIDGISAYYKDLQGRARVMIRWHGPHHRCKLQRISPKLKPSPPPTFYVLFSL